jgi:hypothetical protein
VQTAVKPDQKAVEEKERLEAEARERMEQIARREAEMKSAKVEPEKAAAPRATKAAPPSPVRAPPPAAPPPPMAAAPAPPPPMAAAPAPPPPAAQAAPPRADKEAPPAESVPTPGKSRGGGLGSLSGRGASGGGSAAATARVVLAVVDATPGGDRVVAERVMRRNLAQVRFCYEKALQDDPSLAGDVKLALSIDASGAVTAAQARGAAGVNDCIATRARTWLFPKPDQAYALSAVYNLSH